MGVSQPLRLPIRVLVKGASTVVWTSWMGGPRTDFIFPRVIEAELLAQSRPVELRTLGQPSEKVTTALRTWQRDILGFSPDVIVLMYGHLETIHLFIPRWLERHAHSEKARPGRLRDAYRRSILRPVYMSLGRAQARLDSRSGEALARRRARRTALDLRQVVTKMSQVASPLILVMEILPPGPKYRAWFPGMARRVEVTNAAIEQMVRDLDRANVRYFRVSDVVARHFPADVDPIPDGAHYSPELHRAVGVELAHQISEWADTQPHLKS